jgi:hypothetical protein
MKKTFLLLASLFLIFNMNAQKDFTWFDVGLKVQTGASSLYTSALENSNDYAYRLGLTDYLSYGGKLGLNYGTNGLALEVMFADANARFRDKPSNNNAFVNWKATDIYALYHSAKNLGFFEIGPKISMIRSADFKNAEQNTQDIAIGLNDNYFSAVLGFGVHLIGGDGSFTGKFGLRFEYGFTDFANQMEAEPRGIPLPGSDIYKDGYQSIAPVFAGITFELNWGIGGYAKAQCGQRSKFIMFK